MKKYIILFTLVFLSMSIHSFAQKKNKKNTFQMPTPEQQEGYKEYWKNVLRDSVNIPLVKRDTVAAIELQTVIKRMKMNSDKTLSKDDKDVQNGMLDDDMYMRLGAILNMDELQRLKDFSARQKAAADAAEKERKDAESQRNSQINSPGYGRYGGYGRY